MGYRDLQGMTAVVTGGGGPIGSACARRLAEDGATVLLMGRREDALTQAQVALGDAVPGARFEIFPGDACNEADVEAALAYAHGLQDRLDILVPTVGGMSCKPLLLEDAAGLTREFELSVVSAFLMVKHGVPLMQPGGSIVCISSTAAVLPAPGLGAYGIGKAALEMFIRIAADELGAAGIRINAVRPGLTRSERTTSIFADRDTLAPFLAETPLGRTGEPADIAGAVRFLSGPEASWITGQSLAADGGLELRKHPDTTPLLNAFYGEALMDEVRRGKPPRESA